MTPIDILPIEWIRAARYSAVTGDPAEAVESRIRDGLWAAQKHYKRTGPRTLWINLREAQAWVANQPHVETTRFPKASKCAKAPEAHASA